MANTVIKGKWDDVERAKKLAKREANQKKDAGTSAYQDYVNNTAPDQETVQVNPSAPTIDLANAGNRSAWMDAVANGYQGNYSQYVADKNAGKVR